MTDVGIQVRHLSGRSSSITVDVVASSPTMQKSKKSLLVLSNYKLYS